MAAISSRLLSADGHFKKAGRTVILATHNYRLLPYTDKTIILGDGRVSQTGTYEQLRFMLPEDSQSQGDEEFKHQSSTTHKPTDMTSVSEILHVGTEEDADPNMARRDGKWSVYVFYFQSAGWAVVLTVGISVGLYGFSDKFSSQLLRPILQGMTLTLNSGVAPAVVECQRSTPKSEGRVLYWSLRSLVCDVICHSHHWNLVRFFF